MTALIAMRISVFRLDVASATGSRLWHFGHDTIDRIASAFYCFPLRGGACLFSSALIANHIRAVALAFFDPDYG
jgi:hypothetical protein